jgi:hypothetical protein
VTTQIKKESPSVIFPIEATRKRSALRERSGSLNAATGKIRRKLFGSARRLSAIFSLQPSCLLHARAVHPRFRTCGEGGLHRTYKPALGSRAIGYTWALIGRKTENAETNPAPSRWTGMRKVFSKPRFDREVLQNRHLTTWPEFRNEANAKTNDGGSGQAMPDALVFCDRATRARG